MKNFLKIHISMFLPLRRPESLNLMALEPVILDTEELFCYNKATLKELMEQIFYGII